MSAYCYWGGYARCFFDIAMGLGGERMALKIDDFVLLSICQHMCSEYSDTIRLGSLQL